MQVHLVLHDGREGDDNDPDSSVGLNKQGNHGKGGGRIVCVPYEGGVTWHEQQLWMSGSVVWCMPRC